MSEYANRLALITGASSGIGAAFARYYAGVGCNLVLVARRAERLRTLADELQARHKIMAHVITQDLAVLQAPDSIFVQLQAQDLAPDILVNNAGYSIAREYVDVEWARQRDFLNVQVMSAAGLCHLLLPHMLAQNWGRIINISSITAFSPGAAGHTLYPAAKSFLLKMSQSLAAEVADRGVHVTALCPGQTESEFADANGTRSIMNRANMLTQSADEVVQAAILANEKGREVRVTGWHNQLAVWAMTHLPDGMVAAIIRPKAKEFVLDE